MCHVLYQISPSLVFNVILIRSSNNKILNPLAHQHNIIILYYIISIRTLKRLRKKTDSIQKKDTDLEELVSLVEKEMFGSGRLWGYQYIRQFLKKQLDC